MKRSDLEKPIIIGGCGGSGTTLLRKMLDAHPEIACGPELSVFDRPRLYELGTWEFYTLWHKKSFDKLDEGVVYPIRLFDQAKKENSSYFLYHLSEYATDEEFDALFDDEPETPVQLFRWLLSAYAEKKGKKRWAEKTPNNIFCFEEIAKAMPDAQFIEVIRDGRDVAYSLENKRGIDPLRAACRWNMAIEAGENNFVELPEYKCWTLRYEKLVKQPEIELKSLCAFLGLSYAPAMVEETKPFDDSVGQWDGENINPTFKRMVNLAMAEKLRALGYAR